MHGPVAITWEAPMSGRKTSQSAASAAAKTLGSKGASEAAKFAAGERALTQAKSTETTGKAAANAAAKTLNSKGASKAAKSAAGSVLYSAPTNKKR